MRTAAVRTAPKAAAKQEATGDNLSNRRRKFLTFMDRIREKKAQAKAAKLAQGTGSGPTSVPKAPAGEAHPRGQGERRMRSSHQDTVVSYRPSAAVREQSASPPRDPRGQAVPRPPTPPRARADPKSSGVESGRGKRGKDPTKGAGKSKGSRSSPKGGGSKGKGQSSLQKGKPSERG